MYNIRENVVMSHHTKIRKSFTEENENKVSQACKETKATYPFNNSQ
jgi:hypothetical protein